MAYAIFALILIVTLFFASRIRRTKRAEQRLKAEMRRFGIE